MSVIFIDFYSVIVFGGKGIDPLYAEK